MKKLVAIIQSIFYGVMVAQAAPSSDTRDENAQRASISRMLVEIEKLKIAQPENAIPRLGEILRKTSRQNIYQVEERWEAHEAAKNALMSFPDKGVFFRGEIEGIKKTLRDQGDKTSYDSERVNTFEIMKLLPAPEIMAVLGDLLDDKEDAPPPPREGQDYSNYPSNAHLAASALGVIIANPPVKKDDLHPYFDDDIEVWKLWYAQVKAGTRSFQFKGDDEVHYLAKPVKDERRTLPEKPEDAKIVNSSPAVVSPSPNINRSPEKRNSFLIPSLIALGVLLFSAGCLAVSKRRANPTN